MGFCTLSQNGGSDNFPRPLPLASGFGRGDLQLRWRCEDEQRHLSVTRGGPNLLADMRRRGGREWTRHPILAGYPQPAARRGSAVPEVLTNDQQAPLPGRPTSRHERGEPTGLTQPSCAPKTPHSSAVAALLRRNRIATTRRCCARLRSADEHRGPRRTFGGDPADRSRRGHRHMVGLAVPEAQMSTLPDEVQEAARHTVMDWQAPGEPARRWSRSRPSWPAAGYDDPGAMPGRRQR